MNEKLVVGAQLVIYARGEFIAVGVSPGCVDVVQARVAQIRGRIVLIQAGRDLADTAARDLIASELLYCPSGRVISKDVEDRLQALKIPVLHLFGGDT